MRSERPAAGLTYSRFSLSLGENSELVPKMEVALHSSLAALPTSSQNARPKSALTTLSNHRHNAGFLMPNFLPRLHNLRVKFHHLTFLVSQRSILLLA